MIFRKPEQVEEYLNSKGLPFGSHFEFVCLPSGCLYSNHFHGLSLEIICIDTYAPPTYAVKIEEEFQLTFATYGFNELIEQCYVYYNAYKNVVGVKETPEGLEFVGYEDEDACQ